MKKIKRQRKSIGQILRPNKVISHQDFYCKISLYINTLCYFSLQALSSSIISQPKTNQLKNRLRLHSICILRLTELGPESTLQLYSHARHPLEICTPLCLETRIQALTLLKHSLHLAPAGELKVCREHLCLVLCLSITSSTIPLQLP